MKKGGQYLSESRRWGTLRMLQLEVLRAHREWVLETAVDVNACR